MSAERLFEVIGMVDDALLEEAERYRTPYKESHLAHWGALAACAVLVVGVAFMGRVVFGGAGSSGPTGGAPAPAPSAAPSATPSDAPAEGIPGASPTPVYGGAILPLTAEGGLGGITAEREVTYTVDDAQSAPVDIADSYLLTNTTAEDKALNLIYPYVESPNDDEAFTPTLTLNGESLETGVLYGGAAPNIEEDGVRYSTVEITLPAKSTVELTASYRKDGGGESGGESGGVEGYELATTQGSALTFTAQRAKVELPPGWELAGQSFGFDLAHGISEVVLDLNVERYYLEIRRTEE